MKDESSIREYLRKYIPLWYKGARKRGIPMNMDNYIGLAFYNTGIRGIESIVREEVQLAVERMEIPRPGIILRNPQNLN